MPKKWGKQNFQPREIPRSGSNYVFDYVIGHVNQILRHHIKFLIFHLFFFPTFLALQFMVYSTFYETPMLGPKNTL